MADEEYEAEDAGAEYDDIAEEDDNIEETEEQEEEGYNVQCLSSGQAGGGVDKSSRITTKYMTKYERARVLGEVILLHIIHKNNQIKLVMQNLCLSQTHKNIIKF